MKRSLSEVASNCEVVSALAVVLSLGEHIGNTLDTHEVPLPVTS